jgi:hypothetical protein
MGIRARREMIQRFVDCAFVTPGKTPGPERIRICMRGEEPPDLPTRGRPIGRIVPFDPDSTRTVGLPRPALWGERRIREELLGWPGERTQWPGYREFLRDGRARLFLQVLEWGGPIYWADRLGWEIPSSYRHHWDHGRIRGALRPYLKGRERFPSASEFRSLGGRGVREAAYRHGGIEFWAAEFGVTHRNHPAARASIPAYPPRTACSRDL